MSLLQNPNLTLMYPPYCSGTRTQNSYTLLTLLGSQTSALPMTHMLALLTALVP
jgi:hypothetical protein